MFVDGREEPIRSLTRGDYFGEQALLKTDVRTANVIAESDDVECLSLDREHFFQGGQEQADSPKLFCQRLFVRTSQNIYKTCK